jgi:polar amino acid transport system permease protein
MSWGQTMRYVVVIVASIWYLLFTSVLMVGQHFIEKRFSRGTGRRQTGPTSDMDPAVAAVTAAPLGNEIGGKG